jgi:hypothetical protein
MNCVFRAIARLLLCSPLLICFPATLQAQSVDSTIDSAMYENPKLATATTRKKFSPKLLPLWMQALARPEQEMKYRAAQAISQAKHRGLTGLEVTIPVLLSTLDSPEQDSSVQLVCAQALIALDARQHADRLFAHAQADGVEMRDLVEPALARWAYKPIVPVWIERLKHPREVGRGWQLAIAGLGQLGEQAAIPRLRELALSNDFNSANRLEAARMVARLQTAGLEADAEALLAQKNQPAPLRQLIAATLLQKQRGTKAVALLQKIAVEAEPAAELVALDALLESDPRTILPILARVLASRDAAVKLRGIQAFERNPQDANLPAVTGLLDDPHIDVRRKARGTLVAISADAGRRKLVIEQGVRILQGDRWRALEQAAFLMGQLNEKPSAMRLADLLDFSRPEVFVAAAWALRKLAVPETLPKQLRVIDQRYSEALRPTGSRPYLMIEREVVQLCQSMGLARYAPAGPVLRRFVPQMSAIGSEARAAAIWSLGLIYEKSQPPGLVNQLIGRLTDLETMRPEDPTVRMFCVITLGRMKAMAAEKDFRRMYIDLPSTELLPYACGWALEQIKGEKMEPPGILNVPQVGWFLEPVD